MYSLEKRLIPRALVLHFLLRNKLIDKKPNLNTLFVYSEKLFLEKFVNCFDEAPQLLKLYRDQSDLAK
jgi:mTERF domain-containing protein